MQEMHIELVVNYIQILYLCILKQLDMFLLLDRTCCELHSNLVSLHSETTKHYQRLRGWMLWITFKSCIFAFWNNGIFRNINSLRVVNYIQILYLCILKQLSLLLVLANTGCELHSNLVSLHSETTAGELITLSRSLWITFKSCIFAFWNNPEIINPIATTVVNYIQILYLCILKQLCK